MFSVVFWTQSTKGAEVTLEGRLFHSCSAVMGTWNTASRHLKRTYRFVLHISPCVFVEKDRSRAENHVVAVCHAVVEGSVAVVPLQQVKMASTDLASESLNVTAEVTKRTCFFSASQLWCILCLCFVCFYNCFASLDRVLSHLAHFTAHRFICVYLCVFSVFLFYIA